MTRMTMTTRMNKLRSWSLKKTSQKLILLIQDQIVSRASTAKVQTTSKVTCSVQELFQVQQARVCSRVLKDLEELLGYQLEERVTQAITSSHRNQSRTRARKRTIPRVVQWAFKSVIRTRRQLLILVGRALRKVEPNRSQERHQTKMEVCSLLQELVWMAAL